MDRGPDDTIDDGNGLAPPRHPPGSQPPPLPAGKRRYGVIRTLWHWTLSLSVAAFVGSILIVVVNAVIPPPATPLMLLRGVEHAGEAGFRWRWRSMDRISPHVFRAVLAAEDARFCEHSGFDFKAIEKAWKEHQRGDGLRGASTISQQTAKNLYLWPGRSYVRKGVEAWFTFLIELIWTKDRILETYVNVVEWGTGIYGITAAARHHFKKEPDKLTPREAALLAATLPNPRRWSAGRPSGYINRRAGTIQARMRSFKIRNEDICS